MIIVAPIEEKHTRHKSSEIGNEGCPTDHENSSGCKGGFETANLAVNRIKFFNHAFRSDTSLIVTHHQRGMSQCMLRAWLLWYL